MNEDRLSPREHEIARAYAAGSTYHQIASQLHIAASTVRTHLATIYRKLEVSSKIELRDLLEGESPQQRSQTEQAAILSELALSLEEAISRERALGAVLQIINRSAGRVDDVISAVLGYALELCDAEFGILFEYHGEAGYRAAHSRGISDAFQRWLAERDVFRVSGGTGLGRVAATCDVVNIVDVRSEAIYRTDDPLRYATADLGGARSFAAIPMIAGDRLIGAFTVYRQRVRPFDAKSLELARIFADQSVIAIENARLMSQARRQAERGILRDGAARSQAAGPS